MVILLNYTKPNVSALDQPLWTATHALDWGNSLNPCRRGGQMAHHGADVCGLSCVG
jgi:hypothetical protein